MTLPHSSPSLAPFLPSSLPACITPSLLPSASFPSLVVASHPVKMTAFGRFKKPVLIVPCLGCKAMSNPASASVQHQVYPTWSLPSAEERSTQIRAFDSWPDSAINDSSAAFDSAHDILSAQSSATTNIACVSLWSDAELAPQCRRFSTARARDPRRSS